LGKGSNTTSTSSSSTSAPDAQAGQTYRDILQRAQGVAATPYQAYTGNLTADVNSQQNLGISGINANANFASPYIQQASQQANAASAPITGATIQGYQNPYTQQVVDATTAQLQHDNSQQMAQLQGNQISQGALGGNATGVAKGILAGQQGRTMASTTAGLYQQSYDQALKAAQQQQQMGLAGANAQANYGISGQSAALAGAGQQISAGTLQQQTEQARLNSAYQQYAQAQAFPYQQTQWLGGIATGVGSNLGGTSSSAGSQTGAAPNQTAQWLGLGLSAAGMLSDRRAKEDIERIGKLNDGTPIYRFRYKGSDGWHIGPMAQDVEKRNPDAVTRGVDGFRYVDMHEASEGSVERASGGKVEAPWADVGAGWIPSIGIAAGSGAPRGVGVSGGGGGQGQGQSAFDPSRLASGLSGAVSGVRGLFGGNADTSATGDWYGSSSVGGAPLDGYGGVAPSSINPYYGPGFAAGGGVQDWLQPQGMFGEGEDQLPPGASFEDRAAPVQEALASGAMDPQGANSTDFRGTPGMEASNRGVVPMPPGQRPDAPVMAEDDEASPAPAGVAGRAGEAPGSSVAAFAPEGAPGSYSGLPDAIRRPDERAGLGLLPLSKNAGTGLLAAGLGMMASRSPFLGTAVGEGGLTGVAAYGAAEERDRQIAAEASKLSREARKEAQKFGLDIRKQTETERHNKASEIKEAQSRLPTGMRLNKKGELELIPGFVEAKQAAVKAGMAGSTMDDETAEFLADRVAMGDTKALVGLGRGAQGAENLAKINAIVARKAREGAPISDAARTILQNAAQQQGLIAAERTQANIMAKLSVYGRTAFNATDIAEDLSKKVPRTNFPKVNQIFNAARKGTGDPNIVALGQSLMTLTNEYARAIGGGHGTVHDKEAAEKRLSEAQSHDQLMAVINVMRQEILAEERAMPAARKHIRDIYNPTAGGPRGTSISGEHGVKPPPGPVEGASGFPAGAIQRQYKGKTYYYDPVTKQPYPGQ
jgi:hypothetical protein